VHSRIEPTPEPVSGLARTAAREHHRDVNRRYTWQVAVVALLAVSGTVAPVWWIQRPSDVEAAVRTALEDGRIPIFDVYGDARPTGTVHCAVDRPSAFQGEDLNVCEIQLDRGQEYVYAALVGGRLRTHWTDPSLIPWSVGSDPAVG
jgi:hypothetical protein